MNTWIFGHVMHVSSELCCSWMVRVALQSNQEKRVHFTNNRHCSRVLFFAFIVRFFWSYSFESYIIFYVLEHSNSPPKLTPFDYFAVLSLLREIPQNDHFCYIWISCYFERFCAVWKWRPPVQNDLFGIFKILSLFGVLLLLFFFCKLFFAWNNLRWFGSQ